MRKMGWIAALAAVVASAAWVLAQESLPAQDPLAAAPPTDQRHYSYAIGFDIGSAFRRDGIKLDAQTLLAGLNDGLTGAEQKFSAELCAVAVQRMARAQMDALIKRNEKFFADNAKAEGVVALPSGLQYKILAKGGGAGRSPTMNDTVTVNYVGRFLDGTIFDQTAAGQPATLPMRVFIGGLSEALQQMKAGDKWQLFVPAELGYGASGQGQIPPFAALIYEVELVGIK